MFARHQAVLVFLALIFAFLAAIFSGASYFQNNPEVVLTVPSKVSENPVVVVNESASPSATPAQSPKATVRPVRSVAPTASPAAE